MIPSIIGEAGTWNDNWFGAGIPSSVSNESNYRKPPNDFVILKPRFSTRALGIII